MTTVTATRARQTLFHVLKKSVKGHVPIQITSKNGDAVLISKEDYEGLLETLDILSNKETVKRIEKAKREIEQGKTVTLEQLRRDIESI